MADDVATKVEAKVRKWWNRWTLIAAIVTAFASGGVTVVLAYATDWVDMNSRPGDVMTATDLSPELLPMIHANMDEIEYIWDYLCDKYPQDCQ